ncbi:hypothetical protein AAC387_Pa04g0924 [Persea americana]
MDFSTVVIHNSSDESDENPSTSVRRHADDDDDEEDSLLSLLSSNASPKTSASLPTTKTTTPISPPSPSSTDPTALPSPAAPTNPPFSDLCRSVARKAPQEENPYSTFLVKSTVRSRSTVRSPRESLSGTVIRRTGGASFGSGSAREFGFWEGRRDEAADTRQKQQPRKISVRSIPDSVTKEDPSTKYELLHELGE